MDSGDLLAERYRLDGRVGSGGMGEVWRATDVLLDRAVAVKVLRPGLVAETGFAERFRSEARTLAGLHHPNVVSVYDYGEGETTFLVMAFVEGEPLSQRIEAADRLSVAETVSIVTQAAAALHAVHQKGVVHRDVKPGNLLIQPNGTVVLVDFGVARSAAAASVTKTHEVIGTALYMAPEQVSKKPLSPATDVYALGAVAYHCLAGRPPFEGDNALQVALQRLDGEPDPLPDDVPENVRAVVARAMAREPEDRYPSAEALADAMAAAGGGDVAATTAILAGTRAAAAVGAAGATAPLGAPGTTASFPAAAGNRHRKWWALGGALLVGVVAAVAFALLPTDDGDGESPGPGDVPSSQAVVTDDAGSPTQRPAGRTTGATRSASPSASPTGAATTEPSSPEPSESEEEEPETEAPTTPAAASPPAQGTAAATPAP